MAIALDFGTSNSILARWNEATDDVEVLRAPGLTRLYRYRLPGAAEERVAHVMPSLIHYGKDGDLVAGARVEDAGLVGHRGTFRWLKMDLLRHRRGGRRLDGRLIDNFQAAADLLGRLLLPAQEYLARAGEELVVTMPVEAFDHYATWLQETIASVLPCQLRMLDEATACILGYREQVRNGEVYVVVDFGGGTLDVAVVKTDLEAVDVGRRPPPLGRKGEELGGMLIDGWLLQELQAAANLTAQDIADVGTALLRQIEAAKVRLCSGEDAVDVVQLNDISGRMLSHTFTRAGLQRLLRHHGVYDMLGATVDGALEAANDRFGTRKSEVRGVFLVGGSSLLLGVAEHVRALFPRCPVYVDNPFEAVARGACRFAGQDISATLVHDYCLKAWDDTRGDYVMTLVVPRGTQYPTERPVCAKYLNGACEDASSLSLIVFERSFMRRPETVYDFSDGALRERTVMQHNDVNLRPLNPQDRDILQADPPCRLGEKQRFVAGFGVDANKRLTISLRDLRPGNRSYLRLRNGDTVPMPVNNYPVVKL
jgi:molecular chaperone DnaK (HSP70)